MGRPKLKDKRFCYACGSSETYIDSRGPQWFLNKPTELFLCNNCYHKYIIIPNRDPKKVRGYKDKQNVRRRRRIAFKGQRFWLDSNPKKGYCSWCFKIGRTEMHHWFYLIIMPWACTVELCTSCHHKKGTHSQAQ